MRLIRPGLHRTHTRDAARFTGWALADVVRVEVVDDRTVTFRRLGCGARHTTSREGFEAMTPERVGT